MIKRPISVTTINFPDVPEGTEMSLVKSLPYRVKT